ncbi:hypothetical protein MYCTH_2296820 [Thermothelomyces thermophilus ATCC 42464]|uniref:Wilms tumor protein homolog n=1 Tax=Thermothelomyces thermophilus (strain ATCC 42464 / BCRC 31852 / DSM 1799) TaxID=573729 RepID=G2Q381_THET4|nr:uncharacterized protein MYCTH_2296820 [Thermothelomyces thermophilus ATCC 42464]AEO54342.1 hypothetical protein MYCTH_2296820 [Thermothelomyces thermophilus ATCC 42464]
MASERGPTATEPPRAPSASTVPQSGPSFGTVTELARSKPLKRTRETTPTSQDSLVSSGDMSPSKIARLVGFARQSQNPSTGEAEEDARSRQEEEEHRQLARLEQSDNQPPTDELMSGVTADMNRPQEAPPDSSGHSDIEAAAAAAAARALSSVTIPTSHVPGDDLHDVSPQSGASGASLGGDNGQVVDSPAAMDVDSRNDEGLYAPQPEAPMEDKAGSSLSYPGAMPAPGHPQRVMSMSIAGPQTPNIDLTPRSPNSNKKHKCPYCETEFTRHHNLKSHLLTHSQEKPYVCNSCQMRFRRLHDLKRHSKLHTGEKPHVCPSCDRKFARGDALARHSKGAGGCAGRRQTMGSFARQENFDGGTDGSAMSGELYDGGGADMSEEDRRRLSMPNLKPQHVAGQAGAEGYGGSNTYPPPGQRPGPPSGGLYPPNLDRASSATTNTSPSMPSSHTPQTSISSVPLSAGASTVYSQGGMTESPKPLSPSGTQGSAAGQQRASNEQQQQQQQGAPGLSLPTHGMSPAAKQAWLSQYPPADRDAIQGSAAQGQPAAGRGRARAASGDNNGNSGQPDPGLWAYYQHLEGTVKRLSSQMESEARTKAQLLEKLNAHEQHIAALTAEVAALRQQVAPPPQEGEGSSADPAAAQQ